MGSGRARLLLSTHSCDAHPGTVRSTAAWRWIESSQQLEAAAHRRVTSCLSTKEPWGCQRSISDYKHTSMQVQASHNDGDQLIQSSPPSPAFAGSLHCRILNRPPGQLVALVPMMRCTGLVCLTEVRKTTCGPKWQHSCQAQSSTSSKNVPLRPLLSSILGRWLSRRRWETGRSSGAAWSCQQRRNR